MRTRSTPTSAYPPIIGVPGGGLRNATWAANAEAASAGRRGEAATAEVLARYACRDGPTVIHDLMIPVSGITANIDHVLVSRRDVWIIDSKFWRPARYWTASETYRGTNLFRDSSGKPIADHRTSQIARRSLAGYLESLGIKARVHRPIVAVWPSSDRGRLSVWAYRPVGARAIKGPSLEWRGRYIFGRRRADPALVAALVKLCNTEAWGGGFQSDEF